MKLLPPIRARSATRSYLKEVYMNVSPVSGATRFLAVDLHKHYVVVGGVNARQEVVLKPRGLS